MLHDVTDLILIHVELTQGSGFRGTDKFQFTFAKHSHEVIVEKFAFFVTIVVVVVVVVFDVDSPLFTDGMAPKFFLTSLSHVSTLSNVAHF